MAREIFIASSTQSRRVAETIATALAEAGYRPLRWWKAFNAGDVTLFRLSDLAQRVDAAVFICGADDETWYRDEGHATPRDNVVLEFGMFYQALSPDRVIIVRQEGVKLPSDVAGITYLPLLNDHQTVAEQLCRRFGVVFGSNTLPPVAQSLQVSIDPQLVRLHFSQEDLKHQRWHSRAMYLGSEGARNWFELACDPEYQGATADPDVRAKLSELVCSTGEVRTMVSLGPGDGQTDRELVAEFTRNDPQMDYVPVDLSYALLMRVIELVSPNVRVPVGVLADFEDRFNFVNAEITKHCSPPFLYSLLGNTLGNLDQTERRFLLNIRNVIPPGSSLLLDVSTVASDWSYDRDRASTPKNLSLVNKRFLAGGLRMQTGEDVRDILESFDTRVVCRQGKSNVPGAEVMELHDTTSGKLITAIRRYRLNPLRIMLEELGFNVGEPWESRSTDGVGVGLILASRK